MHRVNRQRADGCFDGTLYYGRAVAGVIPGYPAIPDPISSSVKNIDLQDWEASRWVQTKIAWSSLDFAGSTAVAANRLGPGAHPELNTGATGLMHHTQKLSCPTFDARGTGHRLRETSPARFVVRARALVAADIRRGFAQLCSGRQARAQRPRSTRRRHGD